MYIINGLDIWGCSSPGRALPWHGRGSEFESRQLHVHQAGLLKSCFCFMKSIKDDKVQYAERTDRICHTGSAVQADCKECKGSIATGCQLYSHCEADFVFSEDKRQTVRNETILRCPENETFSSYYIGTGCNT